MRRTAATGKTESMNERLWFFNEEHSSITGR